MKEIAYILNPTRTFDEGYLILDVVERTRENMTYTFSPLQQRAVSNWRPLLVQASDKELFTFLIKEEMNFQQKTFGKCPHEELMPFTHVHISPSQVQFALQLLSHAQKLFHKGKQLLIDLYGTATCFYEATPSNNNEVMIEAKLRYRDTDISLSNCEAIIPGKPHHWFVHTITIRKIQTSLSWKQLKEGKSSPFVLEGIAKQTFLESIESEDLDTPQLLMKEGSLKESVYQYVPYPILQLKDRWGSCADLWMDYGDGNLIAMHDQHPTIQDKETHAICKRQLSHESNWEKDLLETDFIKKTIESSHYYCPLDRVAKSLTFLLEIGWHIRDWQNRRVIKQTGLHMHLDNDQRMITVKGHMEYESFRADVSQVVGAFNRKENFIQLNSTTVGLIPVNESQRVIRDLAEEGEWMGQEGRIKKEQIGSLGSIWPHTSLSPSLSQLKEKWQNFTGMQEALPSSIFQGKLRPYQQQGVNWLAFLYEYGFHGMLADEMGLGKTVQILAFLSRLPKGRPHLVVMPTSLLFNWRNEANRFLPSWKCIIHQGAQRAKSKEILEDVDLIFISYTMLRLDLPLMQSISYNCVILDEAQMIKNATTQTAQAVCRLEAELRISVTGTPLENHLLELWSHFHFLIPELLGTRESFETTLQASQSDLRYLERIKKKISPFLLRRRKLEVAKDLPPRIDQTVWIEMSDEQRTCYDQLLASFKSGLLKKIELEGISTYRMEIMEAILRLRQVCCHPLLVSTLLTEEVPPSAKFDALFEDLETIMKENHKVLVYSQFTSMLSLMTKRAKGNGWNYGYLDGKTSNREEVVTHFQNDPSQLLLFISLKAGGVGLNLTSADYVYLYDPWWNEAVEEQAINRAHRIGREQSVIAKRFVIQDSIEEKMMRLKTAKRVMVDDIINGEANLDQLTIADLQYLLT